MKRLKLDEKKTESIADTHSAEFFLNPSTIRQRAQQIYELALNGRTHFEVNESKLDDVADFVLQVIHENYPDGDVPYHSRWRHFEVGDHWQLKAYRNHCKNLDLIDRARLGVELIIPSVLVDAGAGPSWQYTSNNSLKVGRSEGLALASLDMFLNSGLSQQMKVECSADGLESLSTEQFEQHFKVDANNPLLGVEGRVLLLQQLGKAVRSQPEIFPNKRLGDLVDLISSQCGKKLRAMQILNIVLRVFGDIWPGRITFENQNLGDTWHYPPLGVEQQAWVPFHKLSQWISYSIIETLQVNGFEVSGLDELTALAEYRNGGLILDTELIFLRQPKLTRELWEPSSELIIEWRALTVHFLDKIANKVRERLDTDSQSFPLVKLLEGGTWSAGRKIAMQKRGNLTPPLNIKSDGTVF